MNERSQDAAPFILLCMIFYLREIEFRCVRRDEWL